MPYSSPISASGLLFFNTLFDENAAQPYRHWPGLPHLPYRRHGGRATTSWPRRGANTSLIHIDWMIGSNEIDIDGVLPGGQTEPVMRGGEWA